MDKYNCEIVQFYEPEDENGFLSNFYPAPFMATDVSPFLVSGNMKSEDDVYWSTSEHYYQAHKFIFERAEAVHYEIAEMIRMAPTPKDAFDLSRKYAQYADPKWDSVVDPNMADWAEVGCRKVFVMRDAITNKFMSHPDLAQLLKDTFPRNIEEASVIDTFWGNGFGYRTKTMASVTLDRDKSFFNDSFTTNVLGKLLQILRSRFVTTEHI